MKIESKNLNKNNLLRTLLDTSCQGVKRLFFLAFNKIDNGDEKLKKTVFSPMRNIFFPG